MIISKPNNSILVPNSDKLKTLFPDAPELPVNGTTYAILPHTPRTQIALRAADIEAPAPILHYYDWASADGEKPFQVQKNTAAGATSQQRFYVLNDLGTGKTRASLWAWKYLYNSGAAKKLLVVAPLSTLTFTWAREIMLTMPDMKVAVLHGTRAFRLQMLESKADIYIINHDGLKTIAQELHVRKDIDCLILDELAVYRNRSKRSLQMRVFAQRFVWVWGMTGRPMPNEPSDVWNQCKILTPGTVPKYFRHAKSILMQQVDLYRWVPRDGAIETAFGWMKPSVRYSLDDVTELPEAIYRTVEVPMSEEQAMAYRKLSNEFVAWVQENRITAANAAVAMGKLLQVACGYVYTNNPQFVTLDSQPRQEKLLELLAEAPHKVIVFAPWRHLISGLSALLATEKIEHALVHGDIPKRELIFNDFQATPKYRVLLAHPACVHHGLTLTAATTIIWYSPLPSLEIYEQANARIRRVGQKHKQLFLHLQATAVERKVYRLLRDKQKLQNAFLEMVKNSTMENDNG